ncbi:MAG: AAA family ATPase [Mariniblastus sp.]|nr:AAA family ATPase [Mariniblastus sp.]
MNSRVFVQPSSGIPALQFPQKEKVTKKNSSQLTGAIVRPVSRLQDERGSARQDTNQASSLQKSHVQNHDLENYVNWLRNKIEADKQEVHKPTRPLTDASSRANPVNPEILRSVELDSKPPQAKPPHIIGTKGPNTEPAAVHLFDAYSLSSEAIVTTASVVRPAQSPSVLNDEFFSTVTDTDLVQILDTKPVSIAPASGVSMEQQAELDDSSNKIERINSSHYSSDDATIQVSIGESHVSFPDPTTLETQRSSDQISAQDTGSLISAVSKAIASVLTETTEPEFEEKARLHFESEIHAQAIETLQLTDEQNITPIQPPASNQPDSTGDDLVHVIGIDEYKRAQDEDSVEFEWAANNSDVELTNLVLAEAEKIAAEVLSSSNLEIPTEIAAWDVEDFRWPVITNQMIVSGGSAINDLAESTFSLISPLNQRLLITGLERSDGASSIAITLARWAAATGKKVLLVDADMSNPSLSKQVGLAPNISWINAVQQSLPASEVIVRSQNSNLCIMPLAQTESQSAKSQNIYDDLGDLIDQVRSHFDLVIVDGGPSSQLTAQLSHPGQLLDAMLMVHNGMNFLEFSRAKSTLEKFGINKFIVAQNRAQQQSSNVA